MHNWSCDLKALRKRSKEGEEIFMLEQKINFGLGRAKLSKEKLLYYWDKLHIDSNRRRFLKFLLWPAKF